LNTLIEDMIKVLEAKILPDLKRGRFPDKKISQQIAGALHVIARELEV
jgi:cold shock protein